MESQVDHDNVHTLERKLMIIRREDTNWRRTNGHATKSFLFCTILYNESEYCSIPQ